MQAWPIRSASASPAVPWAVARRGSRPWPTTARCAAARDGRGRRSPIRAPAPVTGNWCGGPRPRDIGCTWPQPCPSTRGPAWWAPFCPTAGPPTAPSPPCRRATSAIRSASRSRATSMGCTPTAKRSATASTSRPPATTTPPTCRAGTPSCSRARTLSISP